MSGDQELRSILASVPGIDPDNAIVEPLGGGLTNFTVRVRQAGADWVLRVEFGQSVLKPASAGQEVEIQNEAASAGLAPAIVYTDAGRRILVTEYLDGRSWGSADLHDPRKLELLAGVLLRHQVVNPDGPANRWILLPWPGSMRLDWTRSLTYGPSPIIAAMSSVTRLPVTVRSVATTISLRGTSSNSTVCD